MKIKKVYLGRKQIYPDGWKPGADTVAYYPLKSDFKDYSGNGYDLTNSGAVITTKDGVSCAYYNGNSYSTNSSAVNGTDRTLSVWCYVEINTSARRGFICTGDTWNSNMIGLGVVNGVGSSTKWDGQAEGRGTTNILNGWHLLTVSHTNNVNTILYVDGVQDNTIVYNRSAGNKITLGAREGSWTEKLTGWMSDAIIEKKARTAQEISDYYNKTKGNYGL